MTVDGIYGHHVREYEIYRKCCIYQGTDEDDVWFILYNFKGWILTERVLSLDHAKSRIDQLILDKKVTE